MQPHATAHMAAPSYGSAGQEDEGVTIKSPSRFASAISCICYPATALCSWFVTWIAMNHHLKFSRFPFPQFLAQDLSLFLSYLFSFFLPFHRLHVYFCCWYNDLLLIQGLLSMQRRK